MEPDPCTVAGVIAGGIDVADDVLKCGGKECVVGENTKWNVRNRFIQFKYAKKFDEKDMLKIIGLKMPITFNDNLAYYDDGEQMKQKNNKQVGSILHNKAMQVLNKKLNENLSTIINDSISANKLRSPLSWVLGEVVRYLAEVNKRQKTNARKIKISPNMALVINDVWNKNNLFAYNACADTVPQTLLELTTHMLKSIEKNKPPQGMWKMPELLHLPYPTITAAVNKKLTAQIDNEKKKLKKKVINKKGIALIKEYVLSIINIEMIISDHVNDVEQYYITVAKNMSNILNSLKIFFKKPCTRNT
jgi:hypothetical protein